MTVAGVARAPAGDARRAASDGPRGWSLYMRVVAVNAAVLLGALRWWS